MPFSLACSARKTSRALLRRKADAANLMLRSHIETSRAEVRKITLHRLHSLRLHASARA